MALGALAGLYACAMLALAGVAPQPPWLASGASGALLAAALVAALVLRARGRTPAATTARLTELQSRIRPHFLFNTLNSAIALVREEPAQAESLLEDLSDLFRHALIEQGEAVTLGEEIALARRYLHIEQVRFGTRLQVQWQLDPRANSARLPPLLLQPLVENAIQHGLEPRVQGGQLRVRAWAQAGQLQLEVADTGVGYEPTQVRPDRFGLSQVRDRVATAYGGAGQVHWQSAPGAGTQVRLSLPMTFEVAGVAAAAGAEVRQ